jgi:hypothetical protein
MKTDNIVSITTDQDSAGSWSPEECLETVLDNIKSGATTPFQIIVMYRERNKPPEWMVAGPGSPFEKIGIMEACLSDYMLNSVSTTFEGD